MNIGQAAKKTGLSAKTLRYYDSIDLIKPSHRALNGYRDYSEKDLEHLTFLQHARQTGFTIDECRQLLALFNNDARQSKHVKSLVLEKAEHVEKQISQLKWMHNYLLELASHCRANEEPHCAILDELSHPTDPFDLKPEVPVNE